MILFFIIFITYLFICVCLVWNMYLNIQNILFNPSHTIPIKLKNKTINGINLIFDNKKNNGPIIIYSHGPDGNIYTHTHILKLFENTPYSILMYDYRGFGKSSDMYITTKSINEDGLNIYCYVRDEYPNRKIIVWGDSIGSGVAWNIANTYKVDGVIITSGYANLIDIIEDNIYISFLTKMIFSCLLPSNHVYNVNSPCLLIHSENDPFINSSQAHIMILRLYLFNSKHSKLIMTTGNHYIDYQIHIKNIIEFIKSL